MKIHEATIYQLEESLKLAKDQRDENLVKILSGIIFGLRQYLLTGNVSNAEVTRQ